MPAKRAYGVDQEFYSWSPIVTRPILRWPEGARVALVVIVNHLCLDSSLRGFRKFRGG